MFDIIRDLERLLKQHLTDVDTTALDLSDDDCLYRKFYFDSLPGEAVKEAFDLYKNSEILYSKYLEISNGFKSTTRLSDSRLCRVVSDHLHATVSIMDEDEDKDAIGFIRSIDGVESSALLEQFSPGSNVLHKYVYGSIREYILNELPDNDALWLLYDWSLEKTKWATVSAYLLESFFESCPTDIFKPGFQLWLSKNNNYYWADGNRLDSKKVLCKAYT